MLIGAADCYVQLHGWGMPVSFEVGPFRTWLLLVSVNEVVYANATAWEGIARQGFFSYVVDPSTCVASGMQYWNTFYQLSDSTRLINYLQSLGDGNRIIIVKSYYLLSPASSNGQYDPMFSSVRYGKKKVRKQSQ